MPIPKTITLSNGDIVKVTGDPALWAKFAVGLARLPLVKGAAPVAAPVGPTPGDERNSGETDDGNDSARSL